MTQNEVLRISEPAADLAVMLAIGSSLSGRALPRGFIAFGEVGLAGEVRPAPRGQERLREAAKLGFKRVILPKSCMRSLRGKQPEGVELLPVADIRELMRLF